MTKKFRTALLCCAGAVVLLAAVFLVALRQYDMHGRISSMNLEAKTHCHYIGKDGLCDLTQFFELPQSGEYFVTGEHHGTDYYKVYAGGLVQADTLLLGEAGTAANGYWAVRIRDGEVTAAWSAYHPLREEQLVAYTYEEQKQQIHLFEDWSNSDLIGYYQP